MYSEDSFFTLSVPGQVGLAVLSLGLALITLFLARRMMRGRGFGLRVLIGLGLFWAFLTLAPQVHYAYYRTIIPDLPAQVVIRVPGPETVFRLLTFTDRTALSEHARGVLGWALILAAVRRARQAG